MPGGAPRQLTARRRFAALGAILLALFLGSLDQTVVGTALPRIVTDLGGNEVYTWVVTAYLLSSTITVPIYGKLSDIYGRKMLLLTGIGIFLAGSWLSGLSQTMPELIVFRALQGLGAGALFPISLAIVGDLFSPRERGRYQGLFGAVFGLSFIVGPFIGGWITDNISWHWVFYVNVPIGIAALAVIATVLDNVGPTTTVRLRDLDYLGIATFTAGMVPFLIGLTNKGLTDSNGSLYSWTDPSVGGLILLGLVFLTAFVFVEARAKQPIIPLGLFRNWTYSATNLAAFLVAFGMFSAVIFLPRYYQAVRGVSATGSGYMIWPLMVGLIGGSVGAGFLISHLGRYKRVLAVAMLLLLAGSFLMTHLQADTADSTLWFWMFVLGLGIGPAMSGFTVVVQNSAPVRQLGVATSTMTFLRQIGGSVGLAIAGTVFSQQFVQLLPNRLIAHGVPLAFAHRFTRAGGQQGNLTGVDLATQLRHVLPPQLQALVPRIVAGVHDAFALAVGDVFWLPFGVALLAFLAVLTLPDLALREYPTVSTNLTSAVPGCDKSIQAAQDRKQAAG